MLSNSVLTTSGLAALPEYVKASQLCPVLGISRGTLFNAARRGLFPAPVKIGAHSYRWAKRDLLAHFGKLHDLEDPDAMA